jgi:hypothetical protein
VVLTALLSVALPVLLVTSIPDTGRSNAWMITLGVMVWAGFHLALLCARGTAALFSFFFWLFVYIFMGLAPTSQLRADLPSTTTPGIDPSQDSRIALIVVLGLVMFEIGTLVARSSQARRPLVHRPPDAGVEPVSRTRSVILLVVGAALSIYFIRTLGIGTLFSNRANAATTRQAAWPDSAIRGIVYATAIYPTLIAAGAMSQLRGSVAQPWRRIGWFGLLFTAVLLAVVVSPLATARYNFGTVLFALTVFFGSVATAQRVRITMAARPRAGGSSGSTSPTATTTASGRSATPTCSGGPAMPRRSGSSPGACSSGCREWSGTTSPWTPGPCSPSSRATPTRTCPRRCGPRPWSTPGCPAS